MDKINIPISRISAITQYENPTKFLCKPEYEVILRNGNTMRCKGFEIEKDYPNRIIFHDLKINWEG
ncbi:MAG: hypothetical protein IJ094_13000 [Bacilli bacterium]|nr:hypothetical protein [Bacilli bacterium]